MKKHALTFKIIGTVFIVVSTILFMIISLDYLSLAIIVQYGSITRYLAYTLSFMVSTALPLLLAFSAVFYIYLIPLQKVDNALNEKRRADASLTAQAMRRMYSLPFLTMTLNFVGFTGGFFLFAFQFHYWADFFSLKIMSYLVFCLAGSFIYSFIQTSLHNQILAETRKRLNATEIPKDAHPGRFGLQRRTILLAGALMVYGLSFFMHKQFIFMENDTAYAAMNSAIAKGPMVKDAAEAEYLAYLKAKFGHYIPNESVLMHLLSVEARRQIAYQYQIFCLTEFLYLVMVAFAATWIYSRELMYQIKFQTLSIESILEGRESLTKRINIIQYDEAGMLTAAINRFMDKFTSMICEIKSGSSGLDDSSCSLDGHIQDASSAIQEMVASIGQISKDTGGQMKTVDSVKDVAAKVIDQISSINANVNTQASFVEQTSASMQEMAASIASVAAVTERADGLSADLVRVSREGAEAMGDLAEAIKAIEAASNQVLGIVGILTAIASQTDLLSMNAAIEAAHAGDSGRGFAVVAGEIRRLAEDSRVQAAEIAACVDDMLKKVTRGVELSAGAQASFQKIDQDIVETTGLIREIAHATVEQRSSTSEILNSIGSVVRATEGVRSIASALKGMGEEIAASMEELYGVSAHIDLAAKEQSQGNQQIVSLVTNVREVSRRNVDIVERLKSTIERFAFEAGQAQA